MKTISKRKEPDHKKDRHLFTFWQISNVNNGFFMYVFMITFWCHFEAVFFANQQLCSPEIKSSLNVIPEILKNL